MHRCTVHYIVSDLVELQQGASLPVEAILSLQLFVEAHSFVSSFSGYSFHVKLSPVKHLVPLFQLLS